MLLMAVQIVSFSVERDVEMALGGPNEKGVQGVALHIVESRAETRHTSTVRSSTP